MSAKQNWYLIPDEALIETPALLFYEARILENIHILKGMIDDSGRLRPHVKTHKCLEITGMLISAGISKFKCATIAEAEMLGMAGAKDVLLAYQPVAANINRLLKLKKQYPDTIFSCLIDSIQIALELGKQAKENNLILDVYLDLDVGMNRTGCLPESAPVLFNELIQIPGLNFKGLHAYDGHIHDASIESRRQKSAPVLALLQQIKKQFENQCGYELVVIAGGTPTFPIYAAESDFECSPGTFILWDKGYQDAYPEQKFNTAALVASRVISKPGNKLICTDLGHKAVAAEKELTKRVYFLNAPQLNVQAQSEEHLVLEAENTGNYHIGDVLYGLPYHICPTVALYENALCLGTDDKLKTWAIVSRKRKITI